MVQKADLIHGAVYMRESREGGLPVRLISNRIYQRTEQGKNKPPVYSFPPAHIKAARFSLHGSPDSYGYFFLKAKGLIPGGNIAQELARLPIHEYLDQDGLPLLDKIPVGYEIEFVCSLSNIPGEYAAIRARQKREAEVAAVIRTEKRAEYNALAKEANDLLGDQPLPMLEREWEEVPELVELTPTQLRRLIQADPTAQ